MTQFVFGIDGGGTQSRLGLCDMSGKLRALVHSGSTNMYAVGFDAACANIRSLIQKITDVTGSGIGTCIGGCFASAGVGTEEEQACFRRFFTDEGVRCPMYICNDALAALAGGTGKTEGIIVVSGTGSIAVGLDGIATAVRAGGLGHLIGDEGSGFRIGLEGIKAAAAAAEQRGTPTILTALLLKHYNITIIRDLFPFLYTQFDKARVASFAPYVFEAARQKDTAAAAIVETAAHDLALLAQSVYSRLFADRKTELVFSGGVLNHETAFAQRVAANIGRLLPQVRIIGPRFDPVTGACILAAGIAGNTAGSAEITAAGC